MNKRNDFPRAIGRVGSLNTPRTFFIFVTACFILIACPISIFPRLIFAGQLIPGENKANWLFHLTHLPAVIYAVLFLIFALSIVNLWLQFRHSPRRVGPTSIWDTIKDIWQGTPDLNFTKKVRKNFEKPAAKGHGRSSSFRVGSEAVITSEVVGAPRLSSSSQAGRTQDAILTPLDGINHPLPRFGDSRPRESEGTEKSNGTTDRDTGPLSFKFSSAVDIPSREEIERRDKQQLVVSGFVTGPDGKGLPSVLVYLTDLEGNRVGQSCRTLPETGEYKVLASEPGRYLLKSYKRGMIMENPEGASLPVESGKIEGLNFSMIPDGCAVKGRVTIAASSEPVSDVVVRCRSRLGDYSAESVSDGEGNFSIVGVPPNCECFLEIVDDSGKRLYVSDNFETVQKNQIQFQIPLDEMASKSQGTRVDRETVPNGGDTDADHKQRPLA